jgi:hypothetical protein
MEHASVDKSADLDLQPNEAQIMLPVISKNCGYCPALNQTCSVISVKGEGRLVELSSVLIDIVAKCDFVQILS